MNWWTLQQLKFKNPQTRRQAVEKLAALGLEEAVSGLISALEDEAAEVRVTFREEGSRVILEVADNGRGLPPDALRNPKALGLLGMKERAAVLGGDVQFLSGPGSGTTVTLRLPLTATDPEFLGAI